MKRIGKRFSRMVGIGLALVGFGPLAHAGSPTVAKEVSGRFVDWGGSRESAIYTTAMLSFTNHTAETCTVKRYALHWAQGSRELKPDNLVLAPHATVERTVRMEAEPPIDTKDKSAVVQVWDVSCKR